MSVLPHLSVTVSWSAGPVMPRSPWWCWRWWWGADEDEVPQFGGSVVFPVDDVVCVESAGGVTAGDAAGAIAAFEGAADPSGDLPGGACSAERDPMVFEPRLEPCVTGQVAALRLAQRGAECERGVVRSGFEVHDDGGAVAVGPLGNLGVPAVFAETYERVGQGRERRRYLDAALACGGVVSSPFGDQRVEVRLQGGVDRCALQLGQPDT